MELDDAFFMEFGKLDEHSKINAQGTGLGLSICKRMVEKMGGTVDVDSEEGVGTTFTVSLVMQAKMQIDLEQRKSLAERSIKESMSDDSSNSIIKIG